MKVITLWQPWATGLVLGIKKIKYINHDIKHTCLLFGGKLTRDGNNVMRLEKCKLAEAKNDDT